MVCAFVLSALPRTIQNQTIRIQSMSFDKFQFRDFIKRTLQAIDLYCEPGVDQLVKTAAVESEGGTYLRQKGAGPALGVFQIEPNTERDIWLNYLRFNPMLTHKIKALTGVDGPDMSALEGDLRYQAIMARLVYYRISHPLPMVGDLIAQAKYWKQHYNTVLGDGTVEKFIAAAKKYT